MMSLVDIPCIKKEWQIAHRMMALDINGRSAALGALTGWQRDNQRDFKRLMRSIKLVCQNGRVWNEKYIKKSKSLAHGDVCEMRADKGLHRLFCFYTREGADELVVCTHGWDKKGSRREQDAEFAKCARLKALYEGSR